MEGSYVAWDCGAPNAPILAAFAGTDWRSVQGMIPVTATNNRILKSFVSLLSS